MIFFFMSSTYLQNYLCDGRMDFEYMVYPDARLSFLFPAELKAVISSYSENFILRKVNGDAVIIESNRDLSEAFLRLASAKQVFLMLKDFSQIHELLLRKFRSRIGYYIPFTISILNFNENPSKAGEVIREIKEFSPWIRISLIAPQLELRLFDDSIGVRMPVGRDIILDRDPKYRPYAPPTAMESLLSRALVNLTRLTPGHIFLDPFCGTGSIALEAAEMGLRVICIDINPRIVEEAKMLIREYYGHRNVDISVGDARNLDLEDESIDGIATDPPYGICSPTYGTPLNLLYREFLSEANRVLKPNARLVICHTPSIPLEKFALEIGFRYEYSFSMRVHSGLTRLISVLRVR